MGEMIGQMVREEDIRNAVMLVISLGFATPVQPKAMQGAIFHVRR